MEAVFVNWGQGDQLRSSMQLFIHTQVTPTLPPTKSCVRCSQITQARLFKLTTGLMTKYEWSLLFRLTDALKDDSGATVMQLPS